jgi:putative oxidoreductase
MTASVSAGLLVLRVVAGLTLSAHGAQKVFGWFGGAGLTKTMAGYQNMGLRPGWLWATLAVLGEIGGGLSVAFGFLTPLGAAGMVGAMVMAIFKVSWRNGFWNTNRGYEYPLLLLAAAVTLGLTGAGAYSLDALARIHLLLNPLNVFLILTIAALITDAIGLFISGRAASAPKPA